MQESVKEIRKELGEKKQTKLNVSDKFRYINNVMMTQIGKDDKYAHTSYKKGKRKHMSPAMKVIL